LSVVIIIPAAFSVVQAFYEHGLGRLHRRRKKRKHSAIAIVLLDLSHHIDINPQINLSMKEGQFDRMIISLSSKVLNKSDDVVNIAV
jgi:hypothetical protein